MYTLLIFDNHVQGDICIGSLAYCLYELGKCLNSNMAATSYVITNNAIDNNSVVLTHTIN